MRVSLARLLKYKKRLEQRIKKTSDNIQTKNSVIKGNDAEVNIISALLERDKLVSHLIDVKIKLAEANRDIQRDIFTISEYKAEIALLRSMNTSHGKVSGGFYRDDRLVEYEAQLKSQDIDKRTSKIETEIDRIQEKLDNFNHTTQVSIELMKTDL